MAITGEIRDSIQLHTLFKGVGREIRGQHGVLVQDNHGYHVVHVDKHTTRFLHFRDMIELADSFNEKIIENPLRANEISLELTAMKDRKITNELKQNFLLRIIFKIIQIIRNVFNGHGLCTDVGYAEKVIKKLECEMHEEQHSESEETQKPPPADVRRANFTSRRQSTVGKKSAIAAFKNDPVNCLPFHKNILFRDINSTKDLEDLICTIANTDKMDLNNRWSKIIILQALEFVKKEVSDQIIEELTKKEFFTPVIYIDILKQITDKAEEQKPFSLFSLELLIKFYMEKNWYQEDLPLDNPHFLKGVQLLIQSKPNENPTEQLIDWMFPLQEFNFEVCVACITSYLKKIWQKPAAQQANIVYPVLQKLNGHFKKQGWVVRANEVQHTNVKLHLQSIGGNV